MRNKKAEMSSKMLVTIILLVVGMGIILLMYPKLGWTGQIDKEVCHESVILRGTAPDITGTGTKDIIPLKCKTNKVCLTSNTIKKGECENNLGKEYNTERIGKDISKQEMEIKKFIAGEMIDCWSMMGEGKVQVFEREVLSVEGKKICVVCSRINFDDSLQGLNEIEGMSKYLETRKIPNQDKSYWSFLTNSRDEKAVVLSEEDKMNLNEKAIVFMEFDSSKAAEGVGALTAIGIGAYTGFVLGSAVPVIGNGVGLVVGTAGATATLLATSGIQEIWDEFIGATKYTSSVYLVDYSPEKIKELGCDSFENIS